MFWHNYASHMRVFYFIIFNVCPVPRRTKKKNPTKFQNLERFCKDKLYSPSNASMPAWGIEMLLGPWRSEHHQDCRALPLTTAPRTLWGFEAMALSRGKLVLLYKQILKNSVVMTSCSFLSGCILGKSSPLKEWWGIRTGCPGKWWSYHPWRS